MNNKGINLTTLFFLARVFLKLFYEFPNRNSRKDFTFLTMAPTIRQRILLVLHLLSPEFLLVKVHKFISYHYCELHQSFVFFQKAYLGSTKFITLVENDVFL